MNNLFKAALLVFFFVINSCKGFQSDFVKDNANIFLKEEKDFLNEKLYDYYVKNSMQFLVYTVNGTGGIRTVDEYAEELVKRIDYGESGFKNSIILFIFVKEHYIKFRWGNRFNGLMSDDIASSIIKKIGMYFSRNDFKLGVIAAIEELGNL